MSAGYIGESFWDANTIMTVLLLLLMLIGMCLPAVVALRHKDKKQGLISIICGVGGMLFLIPWIASVVMVTKKYEMPKKQDGAVKPIILMANSIVLLLLGGVSMAAGFGLRISFVVYGIGLLIVTYLNGTFYWGGLMTMVPILITTLDFHRYHNTNILYSVVAMATVCLIAYNLVRTFPAAAFDAESRESKPQESPNNDFKRLVLARCPNGHFYDGDKYGECCPYCKTSVPDEPKLVTEPAQPAEKEIRQAKSKDRAVGCLMCTKGIYKGESFALKQGRNYIGRAPDMDICLEEDIGVAQRNQATVIYEPRHRQFIVVPGDVHELCYLQNELLLSNTVMEAHDILDVGNTSLMLVPCCGEHSTCDE